MNSSTALVESVMSKYGVTAAFKEHRVFQHWAELVGERIAARAWPEAVKDGVLRVRVVNSSWLHQLSFLKDDLIAKVNAGSQEYVIRDIHLDLQSRDRPSNQADSQITRPRPRPEKRVVIPATGADLEQIKNETETVDDDELRELIREARRKIGL